MYLPNVVGFAVHSFVLRKHAAVTRPRRTGEIGGGSKTTDLGAGDRLGCVA